MAEYRQGDIAENAQGERLQLKGDKWVPIASRQETQTAQAYQQTAKDTGPLEAALVGMGRAMGGGWLPGADKKAEAQIFGALQNESPWATGLGQVVPAIAAGVATGGSSMIPSLAGRMAASGAVEAGMGALGSPDAPIPAALMGGAFGAVMPGVGPAMGAAGRGMAGAGQVVQDLASQVPGRMGDRVRARMMAAVDSGGGGGGAAVGDIAAGAVPPGGKGGYLQGFFHPDEAQAMGLRLTPGEDLALRAENAQQAGVAERIRSMEHIRESDPTFGAAITKVRGDQGEWLTDYIARAAGEAPGTRLTDAGIGAAFQRVGRVYDDVMKQTGSVELPRDVLGTLEDITMEARGGYQAQLGKVHEELVNRIIKNGGAVGPDDWAYANHRLGKMEAAALRQGDHAKLGDVGAYKQALMDGMIEQAPPGVKEALTQANAQYRVLKALTSNSAVMDAQGKINVRSFSNALGKNPGRFKLAQTDELLRAVNTVEFLQARLRPDSGTAGRLLAAMPRAAGAAGPLGALGGIGAGIGAAYNAFKD